jgi:hypothetical protein
LKINGFFPKYKFRSFWVKKYLEIQFIVDFIGYGQHFASSVVGVIEDQNSSFYIVGHRMSFQTWAIDDHLRAMVYY